MFLAGLWGPALMAFGVGILVSKDHYVRIYRSLGQEPFAMLVFGLLAVALGVWHVHAHATWNTAAEAIVSLLGWALLLKGLVMAIMPQWSVDKSAWFGSNQAWLTGAAAVTVGVGAYLSWIAYMA